MKFAISSILILNLVYSSISNAEETLVVLSCSVTDEWLEKVVEASTRDPRPKKHEIAKKLDENKFKNIEITFDASNKMVGIGTLLGTQVAYFISDKYVVYTTADDQDSKNSVLIRHSGIFVLNLGLRITYECNQQGRNI